MTAKWYWRDPRVGTAEITSVLRTDEWSVTENAEEGSVGAASLTADDRDGTFSVRKMLGNRIEAVDTDCPGDVVIWAGHISDQRFSHGDTVLGLQVENATMDRNYAWGCRVMTGTDCKRTAETDAQRMSWLLRTDEANAQFDDVTAFVNTAVGTPMDAADYRGQTFDQVASDCAQASGKNWWAQGIGTAIGSAIRTYAWYDYDTSTAYTGTCVITNDPALIDEATYWAPFQEAELLRDHSRIYSGGYGTYDGGAVYVTNATTASAYEKRDTVVPIPNVKTAAKAKARLTRILAGMGAPHYRATVTVRVPASVVNQFKAGMRLQASFTHFPAPYNGLCWYRILNRTVSQRAAGKLYDVRLEMTPLGSMSCSLSIGSAVTASITDQAYSTGSYSIGVGPAAASAVVAVMTAGVFNTPGDTGMALSGVTTLFSHDFVANDTTAMGYAASASPVTVTGSYTGGYHASTEGRESAAIAALPTAATSPVQSATAVSNAGLGGVATLASAPTPGNILVMMLGIRALNGSQDYPPASDLYPATGWTKLASGWAAAEPAGARCCSAVYARCVQPGDGRDWGQASGGWAAAICVSEWAPL